MSKVFKVAYGAGHGINTAGKRSPADEREWSFNNKVIVAFEEELKRYANVSLMRMDDKTGKTDVPLRTRTNKANNWGADIYFSSHHNAFKSQWGSHTGTETFYSKGSVNGKKLAELIHKAQLDAYGLRDRGLKTDNLHITRETKMPAVLSEGGFMDSTIDIKKLRDDKVLRQAGVNTARAVATYGGLKLKSGQSNPPTSKPNPKPNPKPSKPSSSGTSIVSYLDSKGITSSLANRKKLGVEYGVVSKESQYTGTAKQNIALLNAMKSGKKPSKPAPTPSKPSGSIGKGTKVKVKSSARKYATGENMPSSVKGKTYTSHQKPRSRNGKREVLLSEIMSWVYESDVEVVSGGTSKPATKPSSAKKKFNLPNKTLSHRSPQLNGSDVREVQRALASIHFYPEKGAKNNGVDGYYGAKTANAVKRFQSMYGLKQDGIYGAATRKKLDELVN